MEKLYREKSFFKKKKVHAKEVLNNSKNSFLPSLSPLNYLVSHRRAFNIATWNLINWTM